MSHKCQNCVTATFLNTVPCLGSRGTRSWGEGAELRGRKQMDFFNI